MSCSEMAILAPTNCLDSSAEAVDYPESLLVERPEGNDSLSAGENKNGNLYAALGKVIRERRKELALSQQDLADISGVDRAFLSNVERGTKRPSFGLVSNIAKGLKLKFSRLVSRCENCQAGQPLVQKGWSDGDADASRDEVKGAAERRS